MTLTKRAKLGVVGGVAALAAAGTGTAVAAGGGDGGNPITGPKADQARAAAIAAVPGGHAGAVRPESDNGAAYGVEVTRADGSQVMVFLNGADRVLGTQPNGPGNDSGGDGGDGGDGG